MNKVINFNEYFLVNGTWKCVKLYKEIVRNELFECIDITNNTYHAYHSKELIPITKLERALIINNQFPSDIDSRATLHTILWEIEKGSTPSTASEMERKLYLVCEQARACLMSWISDEGMSPMDKQFSKMVGELTDVINEYNEAYPSQLKHHIFCNFQTGDPEKCKCKKMHDLYPQGDMTPDELVKKYFPNVIFINKTEKQNEK